MGCGRATAANEDQILRRQKAIQSDDRLNRIVGQATLVQASGLRCEAIFADGNVIRSQ